jgi:hypothetical protein
MTSDEKVKELTQILDFKIVRMEINPSKEELDEVKDIMRKYEDQYNKNCTKMQDYERHMQ